MAEIGGGQATCRVKMHRADVNATKVSCEEVEGVYYKIDAVLAPETIINGCDYGGYSFSTPSNIFRNIGTGSAKYASFTLTVARPITLTGPAGDTVEVDGWALTSAIKEQRERTASISSSAARAAENAFSENEQKLNLAAMAITKSVERDRAEPPRARISKDAPAKAAPRERPRAEAAAAPATPPAVPAPPPARSQRAAALSGVKLMDGRRQREDAGGAPAAKHMAPASARRAGAPPREEPVEEVLTGAAAADMGGERAGAGATAERELTKTEKEVRDQILRSFAALKATPAHAGAPAHARREARACDSDSGSARAAVDPDLFPVLGVEDLEDQIESAVESERAARVRAAASR